MAVCLQCRFANPDGAFECGRCGAGLVDTTESGIHVPLPAPMTEPIAAPNKPPPDEQAPRGAAQKRVNTRYPGVRRELRSHGRAARDRPSATRPRMSFRRTMQSPPAEPSRLTPAFPDTR